MSLLTRQPVVLVRLCPQLLTFQPRLARLSRTVARHLQRNSHAQGESQMSKTKTLMACAQQVCQSLKVVEASSVSLSCCRWEKAEAQALVALEVAADVETVKVLRLWMMMSLCYLLWLID